MKRRAATSLAVLALLGTVDTQAGPLRERLAERAEQRRAGAEAEVRLPAGSSVQRNIAYGEHADQRMDGLHSRRCP